MVRRSILEQGNNRWRIEHADRIAFLVDAALYFETLEDAFERARQNIYFAGGDIDSRISLRPSEDREKPSERFSEFLKANVGRTPGLEAYILCWDYAMVYVMQRECLTLFNISWKNHKRIHLKTDAEHPLGAYILGGLVMVPISLLVGASAIAFGAFPGIPYALGGCLLSAVVFYGIGAKLGRDTLPRFTGGKLQRLSTHLARQGILTMALARNIPVAPFSLVNMVAGASQIGFRDFVLGTALGMTPGILGITVFTNRLLKTLREPNWFNIVLVAVVGALLIAGIWWIKRRLF